MQAHPVWLKNRTRSAGCVSKIWSPSGIAIQGCLLRVQKCTVGRCQEVSAKVPPRTLRTVMPGREPQTHEPHSGQIHQIVSLPLSARRDRFRLASNDTEDPLGEHTADREGAACHALAIGAVAGIDLCGAWVIS